MTQRIKAVCKVLWARHNSGPRSRRQIKHIVIHSTEGGTAASNARYFAGGALASTHLVVDDDECYRMVPDLVIPWGAPGVNTSGLHIEHCGYARWSREEWMNHRHELWRSAHHAAKWCHMYSIPRRWIGPRRLKWGWKGFITHKTASDVYTPGGHWDPGPGFPKDEYMKYVKSYYKQIKGGES